MKIIFYDDFYLKQLESSKYPSGGATKQVIAWHNALIHKGIDSKVMGASSHQELKKNNEVIIAYDPSKGIRILRFFYYQLPSLIKNIQKNKPDYLYHGVPSRQSAIIAIICKILGVKFIQRISNDNLIDDRAKKKMRFLEYQIFKQCLKQSKFIFCQNEYQFNNVSKKYPNKAYLIYNPYKGNISNHTLSFEDRKFVVWVGLFQIQKNVPLLRDIVISSPNIDFKIIGTSALNCDQNTKNAIDGLKEISNVEFLGFKETNELYHYLKESYCLLNTSYHEGFSNTYLEAFACGTPVVCIKNCDPDNIISKNNLGFTSNNSSDLSIVLKEFISNRDKWEISAKKCIPYVSKNHFYTTKIDEFLKILHD